MRRLTKMVALGLGLILLASACSDDDGGGASADDPLVVAIVDDIVNNDAPFTTDRGDAECFAGGVVGEIGNDRLAELGVTAENVGDLDDFAWTEDEVNVIIDKLFGCIDVKDSFARSLQGPEADDGVTSCISGELSDDSIRAFFAASFSGVESDSFDEISAAMAACGLS